MMNGCPLFLVFVLLLCFSPEQEWVFGWMLLPSSVQVRQQPQPQPQQQRPFHYSSSQFTVRSVSTTTSTIDYQSDYGRGMDHLSADLQEGHVVVYQTGTWCVDGVTVGDDGHQPPAWEYCLVDSLQLVWSHNCEHGVVRGFAMTKLGGDDDDDDDDSISDKDQGALLLQVEDWNTMIEFGPEQLVARIPVEPVLSVDDDDDHDHDDDGNDPPTTFRSLVTISEDLWQQQAQEQ
eukprot:scaffold4582_cov166-Amphora_coffeaeformis.AAC.4